MHLCTFQARATHICIDCGFIYTLQKPFDEQARTQLLVAYQVSAYLFTFSLPFLHILQPDTYACPQCRAPKKRFARYDVNTGKAIGGGLPPIGVIIGLVAGIAGVGALLVYGLQWFTHIELQMLNFAKYLFFSLVYSTAHHENRMQNVFCVVHNLINSNDMIWYVCSELSSLALDLTSNLGKDSGPFSQQILQPRKQTNLSTKHLLLVKVHTRSFPSNNHTHFG